MDIIPVSPEMVTLIGAGALPHDELPPDCAAFSFSTSSVEFVATVNDIESVYAAVTLIVQRAALHRLFAWQGSEHDGSTYHLNQELRAVVSALTEQGRGAEALKTYRLAKSIELLCDTVHAIDAGNLTAVGDAPLSAADTRRLVLARELIDQRWTDRLTLAAVARHCGLNRTKLTRGFRALYRCSVAEAIAERRMDEARRALLTTDLPVGQVAYRNGYLNNASFARAFGRRFGQSPSDYRAQAMAA